jgi:hypothetical protein
MAIKNHVNPGTDVTVSPPGLVIDDSYRSRKMKEEITSKQYGIAIGILVIGLIVFFEGMFVGYFMGLHGACV